MFVSNKQKQTSRAPSLYRDSGYRFPQLKIEETIDIMTNEIGTKYWNKTRKI